MTVRGPSHDRRPFDVLGLPASRDLTDEDVRSAWRRIAAATHPDRPGGGDPARFAAASAAYMMLRTRTGRGEALAEHTGGAARQELISPPPHAPFARDFAVGAVDTAPLPQAMPSTDRAGRSAADRRGGQRRIGGAGWFGTRHARPYHRRADVAAADGPARPWAAVVIVRVAPGCRSGPAAPFPRCGELVSAIDASVTKFMVSEIVAPFSESFGLRFALVDVAPPNHGGQHAALRGPPGGGTGRDH